MLTPCHPRWDAAEETSKGFDLSSPTLLSSVADRVKPLGQHTKQNALRVLGRPLGRIRRTAIVRCESGRAADLRAIGHHGAVRKVGAVVLAVTIAAAGCSDDRTSGAELSDTAATVDEASLIGGASCRPPTPVNSSATGVVEARGTGTEVVAWALLWVEPPWKPHQEVKVVWRMTGRGDFAVVARGPAGETVGPFSGPTPHEGSNWERPGQEWGTFFAMPSAGCWILEASRGKDVSKVFVLVAE